MCHWSPQLLWHQVTGTQCHTWWMTDLSYSQLLQTLARRQLGRKVNNLHFNCESITTQVMFSGLAPRWPTWSDLFCFCFHENHLQSSSAFLNTGQWSMRVISQKKIIITMLFIEPDWHTHIHVSHPLLHGKHQKCHWDCNFNFICHFS